MLPGDEESGSSGAHSRQSGPSVPATGSGKGTAESGPVREHLLRRHAPSGAGAPRSWRWWCAAVALTVAAIAMSIALGGHRRHNIRLDVADEGAHYAYAVALRSGHVPAWGDTLTVAERNLVDCLESIGVPPAQCGSPPPSPSHYAARGYDYEAQQPPLGYVPYALTANPSASPDAALTAARHGGMLWIAASAGLLLLLAVLEGFSLLGLTALLATTLFDPVFTYAAATVNNDAAGIAAAAVALVAWSLSKRFSRWSLGLGLGAGVLIGLTKGTFIMVPFALVVAAIVVEGRQLLSWSGLWAACRRHLCVLSMFVATGVAYGAFLLVQHARAIVPSSVVLHALLGFMRTPALQASTVSAGFTGTLGLFKPYYPYNALNALWGVGAFGVLLGVWFLDIPRAIAARARGLSLGIFAAIVAMAIGWPLLMYIQGHYNFATTVRYAIPLLPLIAYVIVTSCRRFGVVTLGVVLPVACAALQLGLAKY